MDDLKEMYLGQQRGLLVAAVCFVLLVFAASAIGWRWSSVGAQTPPSPTAVSTAAPTDTLTVGPANGASTASTPDDRIEELSRSQDRFVTTMLAVLTLIGAGFFVLVGLSLYQNNRNFERESQTIREYAQTQIDRAVDQASSDLMVSTESKVATLLDSLNRYSTSQINELGRVREESKSEIAARIAALTNDIDDYIETFAGFVFWTAQRVRRSLSESDDDNNSRLLATSLLMAGLTAFDLGERLKGANRERVWRQAVPVLLDALTKLNEGFKVPEQNHLIWYTNSGRLWHRVNHAVTELSNNDRTSAAVPEMRPLYPDSPNQPDGFTLDRLIAGAG